MIQLNKKGFTRSSGLRRFARQFEKKHTFRLPQLLHPELLGFISVGVELGPWAPREHENIGRESTLANLPALAVLSFAVNTPEFLRVVEQITNCGPISRFDGRVYRMNPGTDHYDTWHDDASKERLVGMSINLGSRPYIGGVFRLREKHSDQLLCELPNTGAGDAILFRISSRLVHMVTAVEGTEPKTAFAGWFVSGGSDFFSSIREPVVIDPGAGEPKN
jgi:hypothetical protein